MNNAETYLKEISQYYDPTKRPYAREGYPFVEFPNLSPLEILKPGLRLIIYGPGGSGKTTFLDWSAYYSAISNQWIPIFISLRNLSSNLDDLINVSISKFAANTLVVDLADHFKNKRLIFLMDGFDEVPVAFKTELEYSIKVLSRQYPDSSMIITSRDQSFWKYSMEWQIMSIPLFSEIQIRDYLSVVTGGLDLFNKIIENPALYGLATRPAFLFTIRNALAHGTDFREYLMAEIPLYTAWRGHTKSLLPSRISQSSIDQFLITVALEMVIRNSNSISHSTVTNEVTKFIADIKDVDIFINAVVSTDVIVELKDREYGFSHKTLIESYAAKGLLGIFRSKNSLDIFLRSVLQTNYAAGVIRFFMAILKAEELRSFLNTLSPDLSLAISVFSKDIIADRLADLLGRNAGNITEITEAATVANEFLKNQSIIRRDILVLSVHGFNTRGDWKNRLGLILTRATNGERFLYRPWDYGKFFIGLLLPWSRRKQVKKFHVFYNDLVSEFPIKPEICIVAHSFGTYIIGHAIRRFPELKFDRVLFLGSALPRKFNWINIGNRIGKMLNLIGAADMALYFGRFIPGLGSAGSQGFSQSYHWLIQERETHSDHSDLFGDEYIRAVWVPFFRDGSTRIEISLEKAA